MVKAIFFKKIQNFNHGIISLGAAGSPKAADGLCHFSFTQPTCRFALMVTLYALPTCVWAGQASGCFSVCVVQLCTQISELRRSGQDCLPPSWSAWILLKLVQVIPSLSIDFYLFWGGEEHFWKMRDLYQTKWAMIHFLKHPTFFSSFLLVPRNR